MRPLRRSSAGVWSLLILCACTNEADRNELASALSDRSFLSESVQGWTLVADTEIRIGFRDAELSAYAGCNHMGGSYAIEGDVLRVLGLGSTSIGCDSQLHAQDSWLQELLTRSPAIVLEEPRLRLSAGDDRLTLLDREIASPDRPLVGTRWVGNGISDGDVVSSGGVGIVTVTFDEDGGVEVFTGCQTGRGAFTSDPTTIAFDGLMYDGAACPSPALQSVSDDVLSVLDGSSVTYEIEERNLTLRGADLHLLFRAED